MTNETSSIIVHKFLPANKSYKKVGNKHNGYNNENHIFDPVEVPTKYVSIEEPKSKSGVNSDYSSYYGIEITVPDQPLIADGCRTYIAFLISISFEETQNQFTFPPKIHWFQLHSRGWSCVKCLLGRP